MDGRIDGRTHGQTHAQTDEWTDGWTDGFRLACMGLGMMGSNCSANVDGWMVGWNGGLIGLKEWMDGRTTAIFSLC